MKSVTRIRRAGLGLLLMVPLIGALALGVEAAQASPPPSSPAPPPPPGHAQQCLEQFVKTLSRCAHNCLFGLSDPRGHATESDACFDACVEQADRDLEMCIAR